MANKISEEFFGAMDLLIKKRLEDLNKDTTILCNIEDTTDAEEGKYIVSNSGLRFVAYSEKTDYVVGQNVWVLVPDGNYENTKLIMGKYVNAITGDSFTYTDPFSTFVDLTGNICDGKGINAEEDGEEEKEYGLIANDPVNPSISFYGGANLIPSGTDLTGYNRIGISAQFRTNFGQSNIPFAGDFGLHVVVTTDLVISVREGIPQYKTIDFNLNTAVMQGSPFNFQSYQGQSFVYAFNPETIGNITSITCQFYETPRSFLYNLRGVSAQYPYENVKEPNLFVKNLAIRLGYSTDTIKGTTVFLKKSTGITEYYNSLDVGNAENNKKMDFRLVVKNDEGKYEAINNYSSFDHLRKVLREENGRKIYSEYPKVYLYKQGTDFNYIDNRAGAGWIEESWTEETNNNEFINNFSITRNLDGIAGSAYYKVACVFKKDTPMADQIEAAFKRMSGYVTRTIFSTEDEKIAVELFLSWAYKNEEIYGDGDDEAGQERYYAKEKNGSFIRVPSFITPLLDLNGEYAYLKLPYDINNLPSRGDVLRNYVMLYKQKELDSMNGEITVNGNSYNSFLDFLIETAIYDCYGSSIADKRGNFDLVKSQYEDVYLSAPLLFTDRVSSQQEITGLIQGLRLTATDDRNGIYNIYKASENANSELIKASDAYIKRNIEVTFNSVTAQNETLDKAEHIFWLIPKANTMIKEPADGVTFGENVYNLVLYTASEYEEWKNKKFINKNGDDITDDSIINLYYLPQGSSVYTPITTKNTQYSEFPGANLGAARLYTCSKEILIQTENELNGNNFDSETEMPFLKGLINSYYVIYENHIDENKNFTGAAKKASVTYQIKSTYRKSLNNNKIYCAVFRAGRLYTSSIELMFGVKGTNGTDYTLSILPVEEEQPNNVIISAPNAWTIGHTQFFKIKAFLYDANDKQISLTGNYLVNWDIIHGKDLFALEQELGEDNKIKPIEGIPPSYFDNNSNKYKGAIIKCNVTNTNLGINITQYFILPVRTYSDFAYIDGPDTITYDITNANPNWYNVAYALKRVTDEDWKNINVTKRNGENVTEAMSLYFPSISEPNSNEQSQQQMTEKAYYLVPKATYIENVNYEFYIEISTEIDNGSTQYWYQPILVIINNYANTTIDSIKDTLPIKAPEIEKSTTTILSALKMNNDNNDIANNGKMTGILIGDLPKDNDTQRTGILGYINDVETYGLFDDGKGFLGKNKGVEINGEGNVQLLWNAISGVPDSMTPSSHAHGKITNEGAILADDRVEIGNWDRLIISDYSDSRILKNTSIYFDGSTDTKALTQKGTWETFNNYTHPSYNATAAAAVKIGRNASGHVVIGDALTKDDIGLDKVENKTITISSTDGVTDGTNTYKYTHPTTAGNKHIPSGGTVGDILSYSSNGTATWGSGKTMVQNLINNENGVSITHVTINGDRYAVSVENTGTVWNPNYVLVLTR